MDFRNVLMAIVLSTVVLVVWATFFEAPIVDKQISENEVSKDQGIPVKFLQRIANDLQKSEIINSTRGPSGGHEIIADPKELFVSQIIKILDYTLSPVDCLDDLDICIHTSSCSQRELWKDVENVLIAHLSKISIYELSSRQGILNQQVKLS